MAASGTYLPTEILQLVFDEANDYDGVIGASHVSQHWRLSARSHRLFTTNMSIMIVSESDIADQLQSITRRLESAPLPLDLKATIIFQGAADEPSWPELVNALARTMASPGIRKLSFYADGAYLDNVMERFRDTPAPLLETLSLAAEPTRSTAHLSRLFSYAPVLRDATLVNVAIDSIGDVTTTFISMRKMIIVSCSLDISVLLSACPALQYLHLHGCDLKLSPVSALDSTQSDIHRSLRKLEFTNVQSLSEEALEAVFRSIRLPSIPTVLWTNDPPPPSVTVQGLFDGLPPDGLVLSLSTTDDWRNLLVVGLSAQDTLSASFPMEVIGARVREIAFIPPGDFTTWLWVGADRIVHLKLTHRLMFSVLPAIPGFSLPWLLEMHIEAPQDEVSTIDFWDAQNDLARGRVLAPRLQRLNLSAGDREPHADIVTAIGLVSLAIQVLGLSPVDADLAAATATTRPDLRLVGLRMDEQGTELSRLFNKIEIEKSDR